MITYNWRTPGLPRRSGANSCLMLDHFGRSCTSHANPAAYVCKHVSSSRRVSSNNVQLTCEWHGQASYLNGLGGNQLGAIVTNAYEYLLYNFIYCCKLWFMVLIRSTDSSVHDSARRFESSMRLSNKKFMGLRCPFFSGSALSVTV